MDIPVKYEDVVAKLDAALGREAALREEINQYEPASPGTASKRARWLLNIQDACKYGLPKHLVQRLNNTTKEIQNSIKFGGTKRLRDENESLQQRLTVAEQRAGDMAAKLGDAYECGYGDGQNSPNGYSDKEDRDKCVAELLKPAAEGDSDLQKIGFVRMNTKTDQPRISLADMQARYEDKP